MDQYDYRPVSHWLGCIQDFCIEGKVDAVVIGPDSKIFIYRETFLIRVDTFSPSSEYKELGVLAQEVDFVFMINGKEYKGVDGIITPKYQGMESPQDTFPKLGSSVVDAVLVKGSEVHVFSADHVYIYSLDSKFKFIFTKRTLINETWPTVWSKLDAAVYVPQEKSSYFFKEDFHIRVRDGQAADEMKLNQGNLWECRDPRYSDRMSDLFDVHGYKDFVNKVGPMRRKRLLESTTMDEDDDVIGASRTKKPKQKSSNSIVIIVVVIIALLAIGIIIALIACCIRRRKPTVPATDQPSRPPSTTPSATSSRTSSGSSPVKAPTSAI